MVRHRLRKMKREKAVRIAARRAANSKAVLPAKSIKKRKARPKRRGKQIMIHDLKRKYADQHVLNMISGMNNNPKFSFITPAIRDYCYENFYHHIICKTNVPFEVIFVGNKKPLRPMPDNFHYIETNVKPAQCREIAARHAKGEFLITTSDDLRYLGKFLNQISGHCDNLDMDRTIILHRHLWPGGKEYKFHELKSGSEIWYLGMGIVMKKDVWHSVGGLDRRIWMAGDTDDLVQRLYEIGFKMFKPKNCISIEVENTSVIRGTDIARVTIRDTKMRKNNPLTFWKYEDGVRKRIPFLSYDDEDILIKDQN